MGVIQVTAERTVNAPAEAVYGYIRDMHTHPKFLPPAFSDYHVEAGGVGAGSPGAAMLGTVRSGRPPACSHWRT